MNWSETKAAISADLYRYDGRSGMAGFFDAWRREDGFKLMACKRLAQYCRRAFPPAYLLWRWLFLRTSRRCNVMFSINLETGRGIYLSHCYGITINDEAVLGDNVNISQNVTIGRTNRGRLAGVPRIGSRVYMGPGATVAGGISVGDDVLIGANSLVARDVEDHAVMVGVPAEKMSDKGSADYVNNY